MASEAANDMFKDWESHPSNDERQGFANMLAMRSDNGNDLDTSMEAREILLDDRRKVSGDNVMVPIHSVVSGSEGNGGGGGGSGNSAAASATNRRRRLFHHRCSILNNPIVFGLSVLLIGFLIGALVFTIVHRVRQRQLELGECGHKNVKYK